MEALLGKRFHYLFKMTHAICRSPAVGGFLVGVTAAPIPRRSSFRREGFPNFIILATGLTPRKATEIEKALWTVFVKHKKYSPKHRDLPYLPSIGGSKSYSQSRAYVIY